MLRFIFLSVLLVAGCSVGPTNDKPCQVYGSSFNMDDQNPIGRIAMVNMGKSCSIGLRMDGRAAETVGEVVSPPQNGRAFIRRTPTRADAAYLPKPGFVGEDEFRVRFGTQSQVLTIHVTVRPPDAGADS